MKTESTSCVIDYPNQLKTSLTRVPLTTRIKLLVVTQDTMLQAIANTVLNNDSLLEVTLCSEPPRELGRFQAAILECPDNQAEQKLWLHGLAEHIDQIILIPEQLTGEIARLAVQYKVSDLISKSEINDNLYPALANIAITLKQQAKTAGMITVINGKAGSGATFISSSLAEIFNQRVKKDIALIDADFNFSSLAYSMGMTSKYSIDQAVKDLEKLDEAAIRSMMNGKEHIHLIGNTPFSRLHQDSVSSTSLNNLSWKIRQTYDQVLVDMSRGLEYLTLPLLTQSSCILIVMQMSVASLRETKALVNEMRNQVDFSTRKLGVVVNRYCKDKEDIQLKDIKSVLDIDNIFTISNNFKLASQCTELGKPISSIANSKRMSEEMEYILRFASPLVDTPVTSTGGFFKRLLRSK